MIEKVVIIVQGMMLMLVSLCYFFDTRKYKEGTIHSESQYKNLKNCLNDALNEHSKLLEMYESSIHKHTVALEELRNINKTLNEELERKDLELETARGKIEVLKIRVNRLAGDEVYEKEETKEET